MSVERPGAGGPITTGLGIGALLFGAIGAFMQLQGALNRAWEVKPDPTQGGIKPAVRIQADLPRLAAAGLGLEDIRLAVVNANVAGPKGAFDGASQSYTIAANDQLAAAEAYRSLVIAYRNGAPVLLRDVANVVDGLENAKVSGWHNGTQAIVVDIRRQPGANVVQTVKNIQAELPLDVVKQALARHLALMIP